MKYLQGIAAIMLVAVMVFGGLACDGGKTGENVNGDATADTTPPTISNIVVSAITQTSATVTWTTDEAATSQVEYGTTTSYGSSSALDSSLVTSHSVALTGLTAGACHYRVKSKDVAGNEAASSDSSFATVSLWQVTIRSTMAQPTLDSQWGLDNPDKVFVLVQLSLLPTRPDSNSIDMMNILLTYGPQQSPPVGLKIGGQWHMATSGSCQITALGEDSARFDFNTIFEYPNAQGINGGFTGSRQDQGTLQLQSSQGPLSMTFAYVISKADVQAGGLQLKLPGTQPVTLVVG